MALEDAIILQTQCRIRRAADVERKTAGNHIGARLFAGKDFKFDH